MLQNLENFNLLSLPSIPLSQSKRLPKHSGIYFAIGSDNKVLYIGLTRNFRIRWSNHHKRKELEQIGEVRVAWLEISETNLLPEIEKALINWFKPPLNVARQDFNIARQNLTKEINHRQLDLTYYYVSEENLGRITILRKMLGDSEKTLLTLWTQEWIQRNKEYYVELAKMDIFRRGVDASTWVETIVSKGFDALPPYKKAMAPDGIPANPLAHVALPDSSMKRRWLNYIELGRQNIALFKVAVFYDGNGVIKFISRIVQEHIDRNWDTLYAAQVAAEHNNDWLKGQ